MGPPPDQQAALLDTVRQDPQQHQCPGMRWRLTDLRRVMPDLRHYSLSGLSRLVRRCRIRLVRGRLRRHSPDPEYVSKVAAIRAVLAQARADPTQIALYYSDEMSLYRQPTLTQTWAAHPDDPTPPRSLRANTVRRYIGALDAVSGRVLWHQASRMAVREVCRFLRQLRAAEPTRAVHLVWDNWLVHRHPTVLATAAELAITIPWLPTYAPWTNPIEKLWRWLRQTCCHHHRLSDAWEGLRERVAAFLDQFAAGSPALLHYVGLAPD